MAIEISSGQLLLTPKQAAKSLAISERTLWSLTASHEISSIRVGRCVRYSIEDLDRFMARGRRISTSDTGPEGRPAA